MNIEERIKEAELKRDQAAARLQKLRTRKVDNERKERNGALIQFGVAIEKAVKSGGIETREVARLCKTYLSGRNLDRALAYIPKLKAMEPRDS